MGKYRVRFVSEEDRNLKIRGELASLRKLESFESPFVSREYLDC